METHTTTPEAFHVFDSMQNEVSPNAGKLRSNFPVFHHSRGERIFLNFPNLAIVFFGEMFEMLIQKLKVFQIEH